MNGNILPASIDVSIIIINFNEDKLLHECLSSIVEHIANVEYEIFVVDNGSTAGDVKNIVSNFTCAKLIENGKNLGFAAANNIGLNHARGKYVLFLNNDTKLLSNIVKSAFDYAEERLEKVFVGCQLLNPDFSKQESVFNYPTLWNNFTENFFLYKLFPKSKLFNKYYQNYYDYKEPIEVEVIQGAFMFCSTESVKKLNGFDERFFFYSEETDLCYRFKQAGGKIFFLPKLSLIHYGGATTGKNLWFKYQNQARGKIQYYQKHFHGADYLFAILFHLIGLLLRWIQNTLIGLLLFKKSLLIKGYYFLRQIFVYPKNLFKADS